MSSVHRVIAFVACAVLMLTPLPARAQELADRGARLAWDQDAADAAQAEAYIYTLYVDGRGMPLSGVACSPTSNRRVYDCIAALPYLTAGTHALALSGGYFDGGALLESTRSATIYISVREAGSGIEPASTASRSRDVVTANVVTIGGVALTVDGVASGLNRPADISVAPNGVIFVAERGGIVRMVMNDTLQSIPALALPDVAASPSGALLAMALDPQFEANQLAYLVYAAASPDSRLTYRLARFRFAGGTFAERAVLLDGVAAEPGRLAAALRFGPDGMLYAAFGDASGTQGEPGDHGGYGGQSKQSDDLGSFNGKVLRLNADGTTPRDQPAASPVFAAGLNAPRGLAWNADDGALWILDEVDGAADGARALRVVHGTRRDATAARVVPFDAGATAMARYDHSAIAPLKGAVLIAANGRLVIRSNVGDVDGVDGVDGIVPRVTEPLAHDDLLDVQAVAVSPRGEIYVATSGALLRIGLARP
jgi:hypothetical protein